MPELDGIAVKRLLLRGDPAHKITRIARDERINLIAMSTLGRSMLHRFLLGSVAAKVLHDSVWPVLTDTHLEEVREYSFSIRNVLCAIDLSGHSRHTMARAAQIAAEFDAQLTLVHITSAVEGYGPGGSHVIPALKEALVSCAATEIAKLRREGVTEAANRLQGEGVIRCSGGCITVVDRYGLEARSCE